MWLLASSGGLNYVLPPVDQVCVQWGHPLLPLLTIQMAFYVTIAKITVRFISLGLAQHTHSVWMYLILVLIVTLSTSPRALQGEVSCHTLSLCTMLAGTIFLYGQVLLINHWLGEIGEIGRFLNFSANQVSSFIYHNAVERARQMLNFRL